MNKKYQTAKACRMALEERLRNESKKTGEDIQRLQKRTAFNSLLYRLSNTFSKNVVLKGGYAMEQRFKNSRATRDIDIVMKSALVSGVQNRDQYIREKLQEAAENDPGDFFTFQIGTAQIDLEAVPYGGHRYPIEAYLDGRLFIRFPVDIVVSSLFLEPLEQIEAINYLDFAGIQAPVIWLMSKEQQFAEKLHAYTLPMVKNSRVKDLADMIILIKKGALDKPRIQTAINKVFSFRKTHPIPDGVPLAPQDWIEKYGKLRSECGIGLTLEQSVAEIARYLNLPVFTDEERAHSMPQESKCYFCKQTAISWLPYQPPEGPINESDFNYDYNCNACGSYRISTGFIDDDNRDNREGWKKYLQNRSENIKDKRIYIATFNNIPV